MNDCLGLPAVPGERSLAMSQRMTALGGKADILLVGAEWLLLTQSGHSRRVVVWIFGLESLAHGVSCDLLGASVRK